MIFFAFVCFAPRAARGWIVGSGVIATVRVGPSGPCHGLVLALRGRVTGQHRALPRPGVCIYQNRTTLQTKYEIPLIGQTQPYTGSFAFPWMP